MCAGSVALSFSRKNGAFALFYRWRMSITMRKGRFGEGEMTLPCPAGARGAAGVRKRRCLPLRGKSASELARRILAGPRERVFCGAFCPSGNFPGAPGNGKRAAIYADRVSKPPQAASPCSWACRRLHAQPPQAERIADCLPPARGAGRRQLRANGTGCRHCRPGGLCPHPLKGFIP